ncbi:MAG: TRAP transporter small permease [Pyramidobacter sp.]|nr:TRAP transporter small permease [Pyramidobacter sp.]
MKIIRWLDDYLEETLVVVLFLVILAIGAEQVFTRYALRFVHSWAEELMRICFVGLSLFSFALCAKKCQHVRVEILLTILPKPLCRVIRIFSSVVFLAFSLLVAQHSWKITMLQYKSQQITAAMEIPVWTYFIFGPACFILLAFRIFQKELLPLLKGRGADSAKEQG